MNLPRIAFGPLLLISLSYAGADVQSSTSVYSSSSSLPTTLSSTPPMPSESTQDPKSLLHPSPVTQSPVNSSLPQQNQTQPSVSTTQTENTELIQEETDSPFRYSDQIMDDPIRNYEWEASARRADMMLNMSEMFQEEERARFNLSRLNMEESGNNQPAPRGVAMALLKPQGQAGGTQGISKNTIALFLWVCGVLLCVFVGVYCAHTRGSKKEPFTHQRLDEEAFDDPALSPDRPQTYDWYFHEADGHFYPTPTQIQLKPMQVPSVLDLKQPIPGLESSTEEPAKPAAGPDPKELPRSPVKLECLSPANLGNLI